MLDILPHFDLTSDDSGSLCLGLKVTIHHAHYDAISIGHLLNDLGKAYVGTEISTRHPSFHEWSSHITSSETIHESLDFWREFLRGSMSYPLATSGHAKQRQHIADAQLYQVFIGIHVADLACPGATTATVLKAAWSCVLSKVLEKQNTVFSFLSANRFSGTLLHGSSEQVPGPCINLVPVRASINGIKTMATLVRELQEQSNESLPHQHVGFRSIVNNCTQWPTNRFNSAILFQNHEAFGQPIKLGDVECTVVVVGQGTDSADVWITATPQVDQMLSIELKFSPVNVPIELGQWISVCFESLLNILPSSWEKSIHAIHEELGGRVGPNSRSPIQDEAGTPRPGGTDPQDVVDGVLQTKHFGYPC